MLGIRSIAAPPPARPVPPSGPALRSALSAPEGHPFTPHRCARWARGESVAVGEAIALLMRDPVEADAFRLGLARIGARAVALDTESRGEALGHALAASGARLAVVDTALASAYAGALPHLDPFPAIWWNGADADFARIDLALAEHADAPLGSA